MTKNLNNEDVELQSECCGGDCNLCGDTAGTMHYQCATCGAACDGVMKKTAITYSTWTVVQDPLRTLDCPYCGKVIFLTTPSLGERLKAWAKQICK